MRAARAVRFVPLVWLITACSPGVAPPGSASPSPTSASAGSMDWSRHDLGTEGPQIHAMVPGGPGYIGVGGATFNDDPGSGIWTSEDALTWTSVDPPRADRSLVDIVAGGPGFVAISASPAAVWTSPEGLTWSEVEPEPDFGDAVLTAVAAGDGRLVAVGQGDIWTSSDGLAWQEADVPAQEGTISDVTAGGPGFVAVGSITVGSMEAEGVVWTSVDGRTWDRVADRPEFVKSQLLAVKAHETKLVATGWTTDAERELFFTPSAWTSTDGLTWLRATVKDDSLPSGGLADGALEGAVMSALARGPAGWVSAGTALDAGPESMTQDVAIWTTDNGDVWQRVPPHRRFEAGISGSFRFGVSSVAASDDRVVVVGRTDGPQTTLWISPPQPGGSEPAPRPSVAVATDEPGGVVATPAPPAPASP